LPEIRIGTANPFQVKSETPPQRRFLAVNAPAFISDKFNFEARRFEREQRRNAFIPDTICQHRSVFRHWNPFPNQGSVFKKKSGFLEKPDFYSPILYLIKGVYNTRPSVSPRRLG
jgi:hypothetical protein